MQIQLLWWAGCPSTDRALRELRAVLAETGRDNVDVALREIATDEQAEEAGFRGSPTILIDGVDVVPAAADEPMGLSCRVYRRRDGRITPTPDPDDLREALEAAVP